MDLWYVRMTPSLLAAHFHTLDGDEQGYQVLLEVGVAAVLHQYTIPFFSNSVLVDRSGKVHSTPPFRFLTLISVNFADCRVRVLPEKRNHGLPAAVDAEPSVMESFPQLGDPHELQMITRHCISSRNISPGNSCQQVCHQIAWDVIK